MAGHELEAVDVNIQVPCRLTQVEQQTTETLGGNTTVDQEYRLTVNGGYTYTGQRQFVGDTREVVDEWLDRTEEHAPEMVIAANFDTVLSDTYVTSHHESVVDLYAHRSQDATLKIIASGVGLGTGLTLFLRDMIMEFTSEDVLYEAAVGVPLFVASAVALARFTKQRRQQEAAMAKELAKLHEESAQLAVKKLVHDAAMRQCMEGPQAQPVQES